MPKISFSDLKLENTSEVQHWAVWLIITKFIKQKWTLQECFENKQQYGLQNPTKKHSETSRMAKSLLKSTILKVLKKSVTSFPRLSFGRDTTRLTKPRQSTICKMSLLIEYGRARFVTHIVTHHNWPSQKGQIPTLNLPSFQNIFLKSIFFQIWRSSFWRLFSVGDSDCRRFDRTFREIRLTSRPEIRSDSATDDLLTALTTPMI